MTPDDLPLNLLREQPFSLSEEDIAWVGQSAAALAGDVESMIAQLFVIGLHGPAGPWAAEIERLRPGGVTRFFSPDGATEVTLLRTLQQRSKVPLLVSADLEGSRMSFPFGTQVPNPLALAAVDDTALTRDIYTLMAEEARALAAPDTRRACFYLVGQVGAHRFVWGDLGGKAQKLVHYHTSTSQVQADTTRES